MEKGKVKKLKLPSIIKRNMVMLFFAMSSHSFAFYSFSTFSSVIAYDITGGQQALVGVPVGVKGLSGIIFGYLFGWIANRSRLLSMRISAIVQLVSMGLLAMGASTGDLMIYLLGSLVFGAAAGMVASPAAQDMYPPGRKGEAVAFLQSGVYFAATLGPFAIAVLSELYGWAGGLAIAAAFPIAIVILSFLIRPDPKKIAERLEDYYPDLKKTANPTSGAGDKPKARSAWALLKAYPTWANGTLAWFLHYPIRAFQYIAFPIILRSIDVSVALVGTLFIAFGVGCWIPSYFVGQLSDKYGRKKIMLLGWLIDIIFFLALPYAVDLTLAAIILFISGIGFTCIDTMSRAIPLDYALPEEKGTMYAIHNLGVASATSFLPMIGGFIWAYFGYWQSMAYYGLVSVFIGLLLTVFLRERSPGVYDHRGARPEDIPR